MNDLPVPSSSSNDPLSLPIDSAQAAAVVNERGGQLSSGTILQHDVHGRVQASCDGDREVAAGIVIGVCEASGTLSGDLIKWTNGSALSYLWVILLQQPTPHNIPWAHFFPINPPGGAGWKTVPNEFPWRSCFSPKSGFSKNKNILSSLKPPVCLTTTQHSPQSRTYFYHTSL